MGGSEALTIKGGLKVLYLWQGSLVVAEITSILVPMFSSPNTCTRLVTVERPAADADHFTSVWLRGGCVLTLSTATTSFLLVPIKEPRQQHHCHNEKDRACNF